jgi:hypothetical protein
MLIGFDVEVMKVVEVVLIVKRIEERRESG